MPLQDSLFAPRPAWTPDALALLARLRFASARQLAARLGLDESVVTETCGTLVREGALRTLAPTAIAPAAPPPAPAYAPTTAGLALAGIDPHAARPRATRTLTSTASLSHELVVNECAIVLELLAARGLLTLHRWETRRECIAEVAHVVERGRPVRVPLVADALAVVEVHGRRYGLLFEVDMGTVSSVTMRRKYAGYAAWWADGGPVRRFGLPATRVVTVTPHARREARLRTVALEATAPRGTGVLWFLPVDALDVAAPEHLLGAVALVAKSGAEERVSLFPP